MDPVIVILAAVVLFLLAIVMALILGWANRAFHVEVDPRVDAVNTALPGANCGGCGYVGCNEYAEAVVAGSIGPDKCPVGGEGVAKAVAEIMGLELEASWPYRPVIHCGATLAERLQRREYRGEQTCAAANLVGGMQGCTYGCLGLGDCSRVCDYDALHVVNGLAQVDYDKCVGGGACARVCPRNIISMVPFKMERMMAIACSNKDSGKAVKEVCKVGCIGCKGCERRSDLFVVENNLARINYDEYDPSKMEAALLAIEKCPMQRIIDVGKPSAKDLAALAHETVPHVVEADFKTTVDQTDWQG